MQVQQVLRLLMERIRCTSQFCSGCIVVVGEGKDPLKNRIHHLNTDDEVRPTEPKICWLQSIGLPMALNRPVTMVTPASL